MNVCVGVRACVCVCGGACMCVCVIGTSGRKFVKCIIWILISPHCYGLLSEAVKNQSLSLSVSVSVSLSLSLMIVFEGG